MKNHTNIQLRNLKVRYKNRYRKRLTNSRIADVLGVSIHRVNAWTKYDEKKMDRAFILKLEQLFLAEKL